MTREPSLDLAAALADERELSLLASGGRPTDPAVLALASLRDALGPAPALVVGRSRRLRRGVIVAAMAAVMPMGGVAAASVAAHPGDMLYPVRTVVAGRTADDPWQAHEVLRQAARETAVASTVAPVQREQHLRTATALLENAQRLAPPLHPRDAVEIHARVQRLSAEIRRVRAGHAAVRAHHGRHDRHVRTVRRVSAGARG